MKWIISLLIVGIMGSCSSFKDNKKEKTEKIAEDEISIDFSAGPSTYVYKTSQDYTNNVPVILSEDKSTIIAYPHPKDVYYKGELAYPTVLEDGYLLDNRGISEGVAFLSLTYEEYAKLQQAPSLNELMGLVIDKDPLLELYYCGNRNHFKNEQEALNKLIEGKMLLKKCKPVIKK